MDFGPNILCCPAEPILSAGDIISISGIGIAVLVFILERINSSRADNQRAKQDWFLNVVVEPNMNSISDFYSNLLDVLEKSPKELESLVLNPLTIAKAEKMKSFIKNKDKFITEFNTAIRSFDPIMAKKIDSLLRRTQDIFTNYIDTIGSDSPTDYSVVKRQMDRSKTALYSILFEGIKKNPTKF